MVVHSVFPTSIRKIRDEDGNPLVTGAGTPIAPSHSPTHVSRTLPALGHPTLAYPKPGSNTIGGAWSLTDHTKPRKGKGDAPTVPPRSLESLGRGTCNGIALCVYMCIRQRETDRNEERERPVLFVYGDILVFLPRCCCFWFC